MTESVISDVTEAIELSLIRDKLTKVAGKVAINGEGRVYHTSDKPGFNRLRGNGELGHLYWELEKPKLIDMTGKSTPLSIIKAAYAAKKLTIGFGEFGRVSKVFDPAYDDWVNDPKSAGYYAESELQMYSVPFSTQAPYFHDGTVIEFPNLEHMANLILMLEAERDGKLPNWDFKNEHGDPGDLGTAIPYLLESATGVRWEQGLLIQSPQGRMDRRFVKTMSTSRFTQSDADFTGRPPLPNGGAHPEFKPTREAGAFAPYETNLTLSYVIPASAVISAPNKHNNAAPSAKLGSMAAGPGAVVTGYGAGGLAIGVGAMVTHGASTAIGVGARTQGAFYSTKNFKSLGVVSTAAAQWAEGASSLIQWADYKGTEFLFANQAGGNWKPDHTPIVDERLAGNDIAIGAHARAVSNAPCIPLDPYRPQVVTTHPHPFLPYFTVDLIRSVGSSYRRVAPIFPQAWFPDTPPQLPFFPIFKDERTGEPVSLGNASRATGRVAVWRGMQLDEIREIFSPVRHQNNGAELVSLPSFVGPTKISAPIRDLYGSYVARAWGRQTVALLRAPEYLSYLEAYDALHAMHADYEARRLAIITETTAGRQLTADYRNEVASLLEGLDSQKALVAGLLTSALDKNGFSAGSLGRSGTNGRPEVNLNRSEASWLEPHSIFTASSVAVGDAASADNGGVALGHSTVASGEDSVAIGVRARATAGVAIGTEAQAGVGGIKIGSSPHNAMQPVADGITAHGFSEEQRERNKIYFEGVRNTPGQVRGRTTLGYAHYGDVILGNDFVSSVVPYWKRHHPTGLRYTTDAEVQRGAGWLDTEQLIDGGNDESVMASFRRADNSYGPRMRSWARKSLDWGAPPPVGKIHDIGFTRPKEICPQAEEVPLTPFRVSIGDSIINDTLLSTSIGGYSTATEGAVAGTALGFASAVCGARGVAIGAHAVARRDGEVAIGGSKWSCARNLSISWQGTSASNSPFTTDSGSRLTMASSDADTFRDEYFTMRFVDGCRHNGVVTVSGTISIQPKRPDATAADAVVVEVKYKLWVDDMISSVVLIGTPSISVEHRGANAPACSIVIRPDGTPAITGLATSAPGVFARGLLEMIDLQSVRLELPEKIKHREKSVWRNTVEPSPSSYSSPEEGIAEATRQTQRLSPVTLDIESKALTADTAAFEAWVATNSECVAASATWAPIEELVLALETTPRFLPPTAEFTAMDNQRRRDTYGAQSDAVAAISQEGHDKTAILLESWARIGPLLNVLVPVVKSVLGVYSPEKHFARIPAHMDSVRLSMNGYMTGTEVPGYRYDDFELSRYTYSLEFEVYDYGSNTGKVDAFKAELVTLRAAEGVVTSFLEANKPAISALQNAANNYEGNNYAELNAARTVPNPEYTTKEETLHALINQRGKRNDVNKLFRVWERRNELAGQKSELSSAAESAPSELLRLRESITSLMAQRDTIYAPWGESDIYAPDVSIPADTPQTPDLDFSDLNAVLIPPVAPVYETRGRWNRTHHGYGRMPLFTKDDCLLAVKALMGKTIAQYGALDSLDKDDTDSDIQRYIGIATHFEATVEISSAGFVEPTADGYEGRMTIITHATVRGAKLNFSDLFTWQKGDVVYPWEPPAPPEPESVQDFLESVRSARVNGTGANADGEVLM